jgi:AraC family transcriptional regulator, regulatory protein of adaptative response / DNA-3-methyladenine glycosylase II
VSEESPAIRYEALRARDNRFDGVFFVGVTTTGVYCRPICPARTPRRDRCVFFGRAAEAEAQGFRACFRCRPELAPGSATVDQAARLALAAARAIDSGYLNDHSLDDLAESLGVTARHLRRQTEGYLGISPIALAQSKRLAVAKQLVTETDLPLTEIAFASGFGSVRRFNHAWKTTFDKSPSRARGAVPSSAGTVVIRLDYRAPFDFQGVLDFLGSRASAGVEHATATSYRRTVALGDSRGWLAVSRHPSRDSLALTVSLSLARQLPAVIARVRTLFDLDARPDVIADCLARDPLLLPLVEERPGLRVPGAFEPFELAVRAVLGQQVSVRAATTLSGRFATAFGAPAADMGEGLSAFFPTAAEVAGLSAERVAKIGMPLSRAKTLVGIAAAFASGPLAQPQSDLAGTVAALSALPGVGPWTANYVAMRAFHFPDAFPAGDLGLKKALAITDERQIEARSQEWRPWRSYAALHLWSSLCGGG